MKNADALDAIIGAFIAERTQTENVLFEAAEVTIGPIYDTGQILEDPHFIEREFISDYPDPDMGALPMHHVVPRLEWHPWFDTHASPFSRRTQIERCLPSMPIWSPPAW